MKTEEFDNYQFHDNVIRGIIFPGQGENTSTVLSFDIDYILDWISCSSESDESLFSVTRATLSFSGVTDLNLNISWRDSNFTTSEVGICIISIEREKVITSLGYPEYYKWKIVTQDDNYTITFGASDISLKLIGNSYIVNRQYLLDDERNY